MQIYVVNVQGSIENYHVKTLYKITTEFINKFKDTIFISQSDYLIKSKILKYTFDQILQYK